MANLRTLLTQRAAQVDVPIRDGTVFAFHPYRSTNSSAFCWVSPGTGTAILEIWGAGGGGGHGQYCGISLPGNSGAYSRTVIPVTSSSFMCGAVAGAGSAASNSINLGCRGCCSHVGIAPSGTITRCVIAQGGAGGFWMCYSGGSTFCCFIVCGFCGTSSCVACASGSAGCGIVCNLGFGANTQACVMTCGAAACACGGDINVAGGISCLDLCNCSAADNPSKMLPSYPAGLRSLSPGTVCVCVNETNADGMMRPEAGFELAFTRTMTGMGLAARAHTFSNAFYCDCGCFGNNCQINGIVGAGYPGVVTYGSYTSGCGSRGGPGLVKITFI